MMRRWLVAVLSAALVLTWAGPAHAAATADWSDGFETTPANWTFTHSGDGSGEIIDDASFAHSGSRFADIGSGGSGSFSSVGRALFLPPGGVLCQLSALLYPSTFGTTLNDKVNVEIINPANWTYVAVAQANLGPSAHYVPTLVQWFQSISVVYIRFSVLGEAGFFIDVHVDDVHLNCNNFL
jgi:hypothetical protein